MRDEAPSVSVVIPAYNAAGYIREALDSVDAQTWADYEVIVVDDASADNTVEVVEEWISARSEPVSGRYRLVRLTENLGPAGARNRGVAEACGEWIAFLDGDDAWMPDRLAVQMNAAAGCPEVGLWCSDTSQLKPITEGTLPSSACYERQQRASDVEELPLRSFVAFNPVATSTVLLKKALFLQVGGFDEAFKGPEDYDLWMRVASVCRVRKIRMPLALYRRTDGSLSLNERSFLPQVLRVIDKAFGDGGCLCGVEGKRKARCYQHMAAAWSAASRGAPGRALRLFFLALASWPFSLKPQLDLPWGRLRLLAYICRRSVSA